MNRNDQIELERTPSAGQDNNAQKNKAVVLATYDATSLIGLKTYIQNGAIQRTDSSGEVTIEVLKLRQLVAAAAVSRCLMNLKLRGWELKALRKAMGLTLSEFANRLDEKTAVETVSRWESEARPMGGYAEKLLRLVVCEELSKEAPGVNYNGSMIADLRVLDPWIMQKDYDVPYINLSFGPMKEQCSGSVDEVYMEQRKAA